MKEELITDYDKEADVLYINFYNPPFEATDSHTIENVVLRYRWGELIGITLIDISKFFSSKQTVRDDLEKKQTCPQCGSEHFFGNKYDGCCGSVCNAIMMGWC